MGANVSKDVQKINQDLMTTLKSSCTPSSAVTQEIRNVRVKLSGNASCGRLQVKNTAKAGASCDLDSIATQLAESATKLSEEQKGGLGINVSDSRQTIRSKLRSKLETECGSSTRINQSIRDMDFELRDNAQCNILDFLNEADAQASCVIKNVNNVTSNALAEAQKKQALYNPLDFLNSIGTWIVIGVIAIIVIIFLTMKKVKEGASKWKTIGFGVFGVGIIAAAVVVVYFVWYKNGKKEKDTP